MNKLLSLAAVSVLASGELAGGQVQAQTPAANPMPDGSRDMYVGLGVQSAPRYEGREAARYRYCRCSRSNGATACSFRG
jgi:outer membrane protein